MQVNTITPVSMVKNEEFWMYYVLRDVLRIFDHMIVLDTGSTDSTKEIVKSFGDKVQLIEENYGSDSNKIGNGRNVLRQACPTHWMFLIDGDEIWREDKLNNLLSIPDEVALKYKVIMTGGLNLADVNGRIMKRDMANYDRLFAPDVTWKKTDYPFESYGLYENNYLKDGLVYYVDSHAAHHYHVRHCRRSSLNEEAFFRTQKLNYYPWNNPYEELEPDWLGEIDPRWPNPYLGVA